MLMLGLTLSPSLHLSIPTTILPTITITITMPMHHNK